MEFINKLRDKVIAVLKQIPPLAWGVGGILIVAFISITLLMRVVSNNGSIESETVSTTDDVDEVPTIIEESNDEPSPLKITSNSRRTLIIDGDTDEELANWDSPGGPLKTSLSNNRYAVWEYDVLSNAPVNEVTSTIWDVGGLWIYDAREDRMIHFFGVLSGDFIDEVKLNTDSVEWLFTDSLVENSEQILLRYDLRLAEITDIDNNIVARLPLEYLLIDYDSQSASYFSGISVVNRYGDTLTLHDFNEPAALFVDTSYDLYYGGRLFTSLSIVPTGCGSPEDIECLEYLSTVVDSYIKYGGVWAYDITSMEIVKLFDVPLYETDDRESYCEIGSYSINIHSGIMTVNYSCGDESAKAEIEV